MKRRTASTQPCAAATRASASVSTGVWLTTVNSCLCDHTSVSSGATLRSPARTSRLSARRRAANQAAISSRKASLWANFSFVAGSGSLPPDGT